MRVSPLSISLLVLIAAASVGAVAQAEEPKPRAVPASVEVDMQFDATGGLQTFVQQTWSGEDARRMRQSLDAFFGTGDGTLTPTELDRLSQATEADMRGKSLDWLTLQGQNFTIHNVTVTFGNASGPVNSTLPLTTTHVLQLGASNTSVTDGAQLMLRPIWSGNLSLVPPEGLVAIAQTGLTPGVMAEGALEGAFVSGQDVDIRFALPTSIVTPTGTGGGPETPPDEVIEDPTMKVPLPGVVALVAVAMTALALRRRRDR